MTHQRPTEQRGFVLVSVLWMLTILTVVTLGFGRRAYLDARAAALTLDQIQVQYLARGAAQRGVEEVQQRIDIYTNMSRVIGSMQRSNQIGSEASEWLKNFDYVGTYDMSDLLPEAAAEALGEEDVIQCVVEPLGGKISINTAPEELLENVDGLSFRTVGAIMERRQELDEGELGRFVVLEEMLSLRGVSEKDWVGERGRPGLRELLTVHGDGRINLNYASHAVLESIPDIPQAFVDDVIAFRVGPDGELGTEDDKRIHNFAEIGMSLADLGEVSKYCTIDSQFFKITGIATRRQGNLRAVCEAVCHVHSRGVDILEWREYASGA